jgi:hypothetical protein
MKRKLMENTFQFHYRIEDLILTTSEIETAMGNVESNQGLFDDQISQVMKEAPEYADIRGGYRVFSNFRLDADKKRFTINGQGFNSDKIIGVQLRESDQAVLFVCTAGEGITQWSKDLMAAGDMMKGYIVDSLGSAAVERAMDLITEEHLKPWAEKQGLGITNRYSPGYCNWATEEQHKLFSLLPGNFCGISLTPSALMIPTKSISGIIGLGQKAKKRAYQCHVCKRKDCFRRNRPI